MVFFLNLLLCLSNVDKIYHHGECVWSNFVSAACMNGIPDGNHKRSIKALIEKMARNIYNIYQQKRYYHRRAAKFKQTLVKYGLFTHGNINEDSNDPETIRRRKLQIDDYMKHHSQMVDDDYNMRLCYVKYQYCKDPTCFLLTKPTQLYINLDNQLISCYPTCFLYTCIFV